MIKTHTPWRIYLALVVAALLWGSLYPAAKPAVSVAGALQVSWCRVLLASLSLGALVVLRSGPQVLIEHARTRWPGILALGLGTFAASQILAMAALDYLPASVNGLLNNTHPLWVTLGTVVFYPPRRPGVLFAGSAIALLGVGFVLLPALVADLGAGAPALSPLGVALSLGGSGMIAAGTALGRRVLPGSDPLAVSALACAAATLPLSLLVLLGGGFEPIVSAPGDIKLLLVYLGVGCTALNNWLWYYGLKHLAAAAASAFQYLIPPMSIVMAVVFLHESLSLAFVIGTLGILIGLVATQLGSTGRPAGAVASAPGDVGSASTAVSMDG